MFPNPLPSQTDPYVNVASVGRSVRSPQVEVSAKKKDPVDPDGEFRDLLTEAHDRFRKCVQWETDYRKTANEEFDFVDGRKHWTQDKLDERKGLPCLTFDRIGPSVDQVVNNMRQNPPEPRISPVGAGSDKDEAEIIQGLLRNIDQDSCAEIAYSTAYEHAVKVGRGWWRITFDWETDDWENPAIGDKILEQKLVIKRISNPLSVYPDPAADEFDYSDMRFCFVTEDLDKNTFLEMWPDAEATYGQAGTEFTAEGDKYLGQDWYPKGGVRVAEYWWVEIESAKIAVLMDGRCVPVSQAPDQSQVRGTRKVYRRKVKGCKLTGAQILERWDWMGKWIPIIPCIGRERIVSQKRRLGGMIGPAIDANLAYDYLASKEAEAIGLAPISQWLVAAGSLSGHEYKWGDANRKSMAYLEWLHVDPEHPEISYPAPIRINSEPAVQAISNALAHRDADVEAALSTWKPNLGEPESSVSGKAIGLRQRQSDNAHFNYADNLARSMKHSARVALDLLPHVYSEERAINILDPDGSTRQVQINKMHLVKGVQRMFRIGADFQPARYDVTIGTGPNYASRRAQQTDVVMQMMSSMPQPMSRTLDLVAGMIDLPQEFRERLRPPDVQATQDEQDGTNGQAPIPPQAQRTLQQQNQMIQALTAAVHQLSQKIETDVLKYQSAERIATQTNIAKVLVAEVGAKSAEGQHLAQLDHDGVKHQMEQRLDILHTGISVEQAAQELEAQRAEADAQRLHEATMAQQQQEAQQQQPPAATPQPGQ